MGELLADLERFRPALPATTPPEQLQALVQERAQLRLTELYREYRIDEQPGDLEADAQLTLYQREVSQVLVPRYTELAAEQNQRERAAVAHTSFPWRGPDLYNRISYVALFFALGLFVVWAPFIPLWEKWIPFALAAIAPLCSPWLPDLSLALHRRRHEIAVGLLHEDLDRTGRALPLPPISSSAALPSPPLPARLPAATASPLTRK